MIHNTFKVPALDYKNRIKYRQTIRGDHQVFDSIRKKWLHPSPEEIVRLLLIEFLVERIGLSRSSMNVEKKIPSATQNKRLDIVAFDGEDPYLLVECKSFDTILHIDHINQLSNYHHILSSRYALLSNGHQGIAWDREGTYLHAWENLIL